MEVALKIKAKNAVLQRFIESKDWSQSEFARRVGVTASQAGPWFNLATYPGKKHMRKVCKLVGETEEVIFPDIMRQKDFLDLDKSITYYKKIDSSYMLSGEGMEMLPAPKEDDDALEIELSEKVSEVVASLSYRERTALIMKFALEGGSPKSIKEIAERLHTSRQMIHIIIARAVRKLKHPIHSRKLEKFLTTERSENGC